MRGSFLNGPLCYTKGDNVANKTKFKIDTTQHKRAVQAILKKYRYDIFREMARVLDKTREEAADKYIIPAKYNLYEDGKMSIRQLYNLQPSHPTRLTSRTGILVKILKEKASPYGRAWSHTVTSYGTGKFKWRATKQSRLKTSGFVGLIKVMSGLGTDKETYRGTLRVHVNAVPKTKGKVWDMQDSGTAWLSKGRMGKIRKETPQTVAMRFKHDTGIRGRKRPFLTPALKDQEMRFRRITREKINSLKLI